MPQRLTADRQLYYGIETTEGTEVAGSGSTAIVFTDLSLLPGLAIHDESAHGEMGSLTGVVGAQTNPGLRLTVQLRGGAASSSIVPSTDALLKTVFSTGVQDTGATTVQAGSTSTVVNVADAANFTVGNAVAIETGSGTGLYEVGWIQATYVHASEQDTITLTHALSFTPASGATVKPSITYKPQSSGHGSLSFQMWLDATSRVSFVGCKGTAKLDMAAPGGVPTMTFDWRAIEWAPGTGSRPTPTYDSATPPTNQRFKINATTYDAKIASWNLAQMIAAKRSQYASLGNYAQVIAGRRVSGSVQVYNVDDTQFSSWRAGDESALAQQFGNTQFNMVAYQVPKAQRRHVEYGDDNGSTTDEAAFSANIATGADEIRVAFL